MNRIDLTEEKLKNLASGDSDVDDAAELYAHWYEALTDFVRNKKG